MALDASRDPCDDARGRRLLDPERCGSPRPRRSPGCCRLQIPATSCNSVPAPTAGSRFRVTARPGSRSRSVARPGALVKRRLDMFGRHDIRIDKPRDRGPRTFQQHPQLRARRMHDHRDHAFGGDAVVAFLRSEDAYIADNVITGLTVWAASSFGANGNNLGEGIVVTGPGHVIARNRVSGFRDALSLLEGSEATDQFSIDFIDNVVSEAADDGVEADYCFHNCRIMRNRFTKHVHRHVVATGPRRPDLFHPQRRVQRGAHSVQAVPRQRRRRGAAQHDRQERGPAQRYPAGLSRARCSANNLLLGGPVACTTVRERQWPHHDLATLVPRIFARLRRLRTRCCLRFTGKIGGVTYTSFAQMVALTSELHARQLGYDVFALPVCVSGSATDAYPGRDDAGARGAAVDAGEVFRTSTTRSMAGAPDLGAFEAGGGGCGGRAPLFFDGSNERLRCTRWNKKGPRKGPFLPL